MRRPLETRLLDLIETHPRAAGLPAEAERLWLRIGRAITRLDGLDTFRFRPGLACVEELAQWLRLSVTEMQRALADLIERGCLLVVEGVGYVLPDWTGVASQKAVTARENGRKRQSRRQQSSAQRRLPLLAPITGGRDWVTDEIDATTTTKSPSSEKEVVVAPEPASVTEAEIATQELGQLVGLTEAQIRRSVGQVEAWLGKGVSPEAMREGIRRVLRRPNLPPITGLGYFAGAIMDVQRDRPPAPAEEVAVDPLEQRARRTWQAKICAWRDRGCVGPMPPRLDHFIQQERQALAA